MANALLYKLISVNKTIVRFEKVLLTALLFMVIFLGFGQAVLRNLFSLGFVRVDEIMRVCILWIAFTGASLAMETKGHIKIDLLTHIAKSGQTLKIIDTVAMLSTLLICGLLFYASIEYIDMVSYKSGQSLIPGIPSWILKSIIPYCFAVMGLRCTIHLLNPLKQKTAAEKE